jgi:hypothetical protein
MPRLAARSAFALRLSLLLVSACALVAAGQAGEAKARYARVVLCHVRADFNLLVTSARNMRCRTAARELRRHKGPIARRFRTPGGFACHRVSGSRLAGQWRCVRGVRAFRFDFSD